MALASRPFLELDCAARDAARTDDQLPGQPDQVHRGEFGAAPLVAIVVQRIDARADQLAVEGFSSFPAPLIVCAHRHDADAPGSHCLGPYDTCIVVAGLDDRADETRYADTVASHQRSHRMAVAARHGEAHRRGIFVAEVEDVAHLNSAARPPLIFLDLGPQLLVVRLVRSRVGIADLVEEPSKVFLVTVIDIRLMPVETLKSRVVEDLALASSERGR